MQKSPKWWLDQIRTILPVLKKCINSQSRLKQLYRKQCINETEQFDFLKDIVASVDDTLSSGSNGAHIEETEQLPGNDDTVKTDTQEKVSVIEDETKIHNHKCSISAMLNDDPVTPPQIRTKDILIQEGNSINEDSNVKETSE